MGIPVDKHKVIEQIQSALAGELAALLPEIEREGEAVSEKTAGRAREIQQQLTMYRFLPRREFGAEDVVCPSALVELETGGTSAIYLMVPSGGGLVTRVEGRPVQVITPHSPLGEALLGKKNGDRAEVRTQSGTRTYRIVSVK